MEAYESIEFKSLERNNQIRKKWERHKREVLNKIDI